MRIFIVVWVTLGLTNVIIGGYLSQAIRTKWWAPFVAAILGPSLWALTIYLMMNRTNMELLRRLNKMATEHNAGVAILRSILADSEWDNGATVLRDRDAAAIRTFLEIVDRNKTTDGLTTAASPQNHPETRL